jgi:hypothetical protein
MLKLLPIALAFGLAGCGALDGVRDAAPNDSSAGIGRGNDSLGAQGLAVYLDLMRQLIASDALTQAEAFREAADGADFAPTTTNRLKYALALSMPGHPGSNAELAEQRLTVLLGGAGLLPEERLLAEIHLREVEQRLILDATAEQLRRESAAALEQQNAASTERLRTALEENRRLRAELDDVTQKLNALTTIEQSIRERENGSN